MARLTDTELIEQENGLIGTYYIVLDIVKYAAPFWERVRRNIPDLESAVKNGIAKNYIFSLECNLIKPETYKYLNEKWYYRTHINPCNIFVLKSRTHNLLTGERGIKIVAEWNVFEGTDVPYRYYSEAHLNGFQDCKTVMEKVKQKKKVVFDKFAKTLQEHKYEMKVIGRRNDNLNSINKLIVISALDDIPFTIY